MLKEKRQEAILSMLYERKSLQVNELCEHFQVTPITIRRDLGELEQAGKLLRTHGGALPAPEEPSVSTDVSCPTPYPAGYQTRTEEKKRIAATALRYIQAGQKVFLGSGSTVYTLSRLIHTFPSLTVVTDAVPLAYELSPLPNIHLVIIGGEILHTTLSTTGNLAENMLVHFKFDAAFVSITAIGKDGQMYLNSIAELGIMQALFTLVDKIYILIDSSKMGKEDFVCLGKIVPGYTIITDEISDEYRQIYENMDVDVILAK